MTSASFVSGVRMPCCSPWFSLISVTSVVQRFVFVTDSSRGWSACERGGFRVGIECFGVGFRVWGLGFIQGLGFSWNSSRG